MAAMTTPSFSASAIQIRRTRNSETEAAARQSGVTGAAAPRLLTIDCDNEAAR